MSGGGTRIVTAEEVQASLGSYHLPRWEISLHCSAFVVACLMLGHCSPFNVGVRVSWLPKRRHDLL